MKKLEAVVEAILDKTLLVLTLGIFVWGLVFHPFATMLAVLLFLFVLNDLLN